MIVVKTQESRHLFDALGSGKGGATWQHRRSLGERCWLKIHDKSRYGRLLFFLSEF